MAAKKRVVNESMWKEREGAKTKMMLARLRVQVQVHCQVVGIVSQFASPYLYSRSISGTIRS